MKEVDEGAKIITKAVDPEAKIIFGTVLDESLTKGEVRITVIATNFNHIPNIRKENNSSKDIDKNRRNEFNNNNFSEEQDLNDDKWDVPAFLRKKDN